MTSRLCSITTTLLPCDTSSWSTSGELGDVMEMQTRGRLVENVERAASGALAQFLRELHALRFTARRRGRLLADMDVAEADALQCLERLPHAGHSLEEVGGFIDRRIEDVGNALALEQDLQGLAIVALTLAGVAGDIDVRQEVHLDLDQAVALAGLAAAALDVERKAARLLAARLGFGRPANHSRIGVKAPV